MEMDDLYRLLRNAHLQAQGVLDTLRDPFVVLDGTLCVLSASKAFYETFEVGRDETVGQSLYSLGNGQWNVPELRALLETVIPRSVAVTDYEVRTDFPDIGERTMLVSARRLVHPDSNNRVILLSIVDATKRRRKEAEQDLVIGELRHRMKNMLAVVSSLARQTRTEGRSGEDYREDFLGRLDALLRANGFATGPGGTAPLSELIAATLEPYGMVPDRIELAGGPEVTLAQDQVVPVSLTLHELATNAVKYGALSTSEGHLQIGWRVEPQGAGPDLLRLTWRESGGPRPAPTPAGFGTRLIDFATQRDLGGSVERSHTQDGLTVEITFPL